MSHLLGQRALNPDGQQLHLYLPDIWKLRYPWLGKYWGLEVCCIWRTWHCFVIVHALKHLFLIQTFLYFSKDLIYCSLGINLKLKRITIWKEFSAKYFWDNCLSPGHITVQLYHRFILPTILLLESSNIQLTIESC